MFRVKFEDNGTTVYGVSNEEADTCDGIMVIDDAVLPITHRVSNDKVIDIPNREVVIGALDDDQAVLGIDYRDEYRTHVSNELQKALRLSGTLGPGLVVGKLFGIRVTEGRAWYVITKISKKSCSIEWRGFHENRCTDPRYGYGRPSVASSEIKPYIVEADEYNDELIVDLMPATVKPERKKIKKKKVTLAVAAQ